MTYTPEPARLIELRKRIYGKKALVVCGAGLTIQTTQARGLSWGEIILSGRDYAVAHGLAPFEKWSELVQTNLELGIESNDMPTMLGAAEQVSKALKREPSAWARWLQSQFGELEASDTRLYQSMADMRLPILTTNYDTLIEHSLGWSSASTDNTSLFQALLTGSATKLVGHLHGVWHSPETVVFGQEDYVRVAADEGVGTLHRAVAAVGSLIYIGFGSGLADPNFEAVRQHLEQRLGPNVHTHYRLCRMDEVGPLTKLHSDGSIVPVPYGNEYSDLAPFLESLAYAKIDRRLLGNTQTVSRELARSAIANDIREESLFISLGSDEPETPLLPPILLPVPQHVFSRRIRGQTPFQRINPTQEVEAGHNILLVGDERSGLTSALRWLLLAHSEKTTAAPICVNFGQLNLNWRQPITELIKREAARVGVLSSSHEELPSVIVSIDDMVAGGRATTRVESDLKSLPVEWIGIACRPVDESEVSAALAAAGISFETRYMGHMKTIDVQRYAERLDPINAKRLESKVIATLRDEKLQPLPPMVLMLLGILIKDKRAASVPTPSLVDQFVELLMSELPPRPSRVILDVQDLCDILEYLAHELAVRRNAELPLADFHRLMGQYQSEVGWAFDSTGVLDRLKEMRVLSVRADSVRFAQATYLYLFVARYARSYPQFKGHLLDDPLFFSDPLLHYSALVRNDAEVLSRMNSVVHDLADGVPLGPVFRPPTDHPELDVSEDANFDVRIGEDEGSREGGDTETKGHGSRLADELDGLDRQPEPFALVRELKHDSFLGSMLAGELAAAVLRHSDQVKNTSLKRDTLHGTLAAMGRVIDTADKDPDYVQFTESVLESFIARASKRRKADVEDFVRLHLPALLASGILAQRLAGTKMGPTLDELVTSAVAEDDVRVAAIGLALSLLLGTPGVVDSLRAVSGRYPRVQFVRSVCLSIAVVEYIRTSDNRMKTAIEEFFVEVNFAFVKFKTAQQRNRASAKLRANLQKHAIRSRASMYGVTGEIDPGAEWDEAVIVDGVIAEDVDSDQAV